MGVVEQMSELAAARPFGEALRQDAAEVFRETPRSAGRDRGIEIFDLFIELAFRCGSTCRLALAGEDLEKKREKIEVFLGGRQQNGLIVKSSDSAQSKIRATEQPGQAFEASAEIENKCVRIILLQIGYEEIQKERLTDAASAENHRVGDIAVVQIQEVRRAVTGLEHGEIFLAEMRVPRLAGMESEKKGESPRSWC